MIEVCLRKASGGFSFTAENPRTKKCHWDEAVYKTRAATEKRRAEAVANLRASIRADIEAEIKRLQALLLEV